MVGASIQGAKGEPRCSRLSESGVTCDHAGADVRGRSGQPGLPAQPRSPAGRAGRTGRATGRGPGGRPRYAERHRSRGRLLVRERIELLLDRDSPFLELSSLAAWGTEFTVGASVVTGVGVVSGVECVIIAHDPTVRGGAMRSEEHTSELQSQF